MIDGEIGLRKYRAFAITVEFILITLMCCAVVGVCLAIFTDNLSDLFSSDRNYKKIFERKFE